MKFIVVKNFVGAYGKIITKVLNENEELVFATVDKWASYIIASDLIKHITKTALRFYLANIPTGKTTICLKELQEVITKEYTDTPEYVAANNMAFIAPKVKPQDTVIVTADNIVYVNGKFAYFSISDLYEKNMSKRCCTRQAFSKRISPKRGTAVSGKEVLGMFEITTRQEKAESTMSKTAPKYFDEFKPLMMKWI